MIPGSAATFGTAPIILRAAVLESIGVPHCFTTRRGGVSRGIFESLNFGNPSGIDAAVRDRPGEIGRNFELVLEELGVRGRRVVQVHQVHGCEVAVSGPGGAGGLDGKGMGSVQADAIVSEQAGEVVAVRVADCCPVLLASADGGLVAAVHAGWRGCVVGVVASTVAMMRGRTSERLVAAIGPCIGPEHFEVGPEVAEAFYQVFGAATEVVSGERHGKAKVNLQAALRLQLGVLGVADVETVEGCTYSRADLYFSHRRDAGMSGRMVGLIGARS